MPLPADAHSQIAEHLDPPDLGRVAMTCTALSQGSGPYVQRRMALQHERLMQRSAADETFVSLDELLQQVQRVGALPASVSSAELAALRSDALRYPRPGSVAARAAAQPLVDGAIRALVPQSRWIHLEKYISLLPINTSPEAIQAMVPWLLQKVQQQPMAMQSKLASNMLHWLTEVLPPQGRASLLLNAADAVAQASPSTQAAVMRAAIRNGLHLVPASEQHAVVEQLLRRAASLPPEQQTAVLGNLMARAHEALPAGAHAQVLDAVLAQASHWQDPALWTHLLGEVSIGLSRRAASAGGGARMALQVSDRLAALSPAVRGPAMAAWLGSQRENIPDATQAALARQVLQDLPRAAESDRAAVLAHIWSVVSDGMQTVEDPGLVRALTAASSLLPPEQRVGLIRDQLTFILRPAQHRLSGVSPMLLGALRAQLSVLPAEHLGLLQEAIAQHLPPAAQNVCWGDGALMFTR